MLFNSWQYLILLGATAILYWLVPVLRLRQVILLVASAVFYMSWSILYFWMLMGTALLHWLVTARLTHGKGKSLVHGIVGLSLLGLAYFKYADFVLASFVAAKELVGLRVDAHQPSNIVLPLAISFYVFQLIAYTVDVLRGKAEHEKDLVVFLLFSCFFPHLIAGPICRTWNLLPALKKLHEFDSRKVYDGAFFFLSGFFLKTGVADNLAPYVGNIFGAPSSYSGFDCLFGGTIGFGLQIYCDFWGYSLMALGSSLIFGISLPYNFNSPYVATSMQDFWHRWHMTLSTWLRDYLYIPLGGNRLGRWKTYRNLLLTMVLGGLWHGANWTFVVWGAIHGIALVVEKFFQEIFPSVTPDKGGSRWSPLGWLVTMVVVFTAWIFFRATNVHEAFEMISRIIQVTDGWTASRLDARFWEVLACFIPLHFVVHRLTYKASLAAQPAWLGYVAIPFLGALSLIFYVSGGDFIYFQF